MEQFESINAKIVEGYARVRKKENLAGCDKWLEAWEGIKTVLAEGAAEDVYELEDMYDWTEFISNYVQDVEFELHNAGIEDKSYHKKCAIYCEELLQWCGDDEEEIRNTRNSMAESYYSSGDVTKCEQLYEEWLRDDPDWGWGYVRWSDNYWFGAGNDHFDKAEEILLRGYARDGLRDKIAVVDRLASIYKEMGKLEKAESYDRMFSVMKRFAPRGSPYYDPTAAAKAGRNEPCPCGSGKKYKKCCGA